MSKILLIVLASSIFIACTTQNLKSDSRQPASIRSVFKDGLFEEEIAEAASANLGIKNARVIIDNDAAFAAKLSAIESAQKEIRMVYFIYSFDYSSSVISEALIRKAQSGVKVKILVDYLTNFKNFDQFAMLEKYGAGNLEVRFYGKPSNKIMRDAIFFTLPCAKKARTGPKDCSKEKWKEIAKLGASDENDERRSTFFSRMFLAGLYAKSGLALKNSLLLGGQINPKDYTEGGAKTPEQKEQLKDFAELVYRAAFKGEISAKIKLYLATIFMADEVNPLLNELTGRLPFDQVEASSGTDWEHLTDYTHHKLLIVDSQKMQLGGRNIEDSYHMKKSDLSSKYTFMDTDFYAELSSGGKRVESAYDRMWEFSEMVATLKQVSKETPYEFVANGNYWSQAVERCQKNPTESCLSEMPKPSDYKTPEQRIDLAYQALQKNAETYNSYRPSALMTWSSNSKDALSAGDVEDALFYYIENLHFDQDKKRIKRKFGSSWGEERKFGKDIHYLWYEALANACIASEKDKQPREVMIHNAYFLPPAGMIRTFAQMIDGSYDCSRVSVSLITNSIATTDLNPINILANYQMAAFFEVYANRNAWFGRDAESRAAKFRIYDYLPSKEGLGFSLHSKLSLLGDDLIIGSANADIRSYFMDTNNGVFIRGASDFAKEYAAYIKSNVLDPSVTSDRTEFYITEGPKKMRQINEELLNYMLQVYGKKNPDGTTTPRKLSPRVREGILSTIDKLGGKIYTSTREMLSYKHAQGLPDERKQERLNELNREMKSLDDFFKPF
jgi:cardiolipin synthase C